jgi:hypothetical protein
MSTQALEQLLALRRLRERQASSALARALARQQEQERQLAEMKQQQRALAEAVVARISAIYQASIDSLFLPGELDILVAAVDHQYRLEAEMQTAVQAAQALLATLTQETEQARRLMQERSRTVQKLDSLATEFRAAADARAEIVEESEAERPFTALGSVLSLS